MGIISTFTNLFRPRIEGGSWFYPFASNANPFADIDYLESYCSIPELNAIINMKANSFSNGILKIVNDKGQEQIDHPLIPLLNTPNWFQAQKEFMKQTKTLHEIFGNEYIYTLTPVGLEKNIKALFTIPSNLVKSKYTSNDYFFNHPTGENIKYYILNSGSETEIDAKNIIHMNDNRAIILKANDPTLLKGQSKMRALTVAINNIRMAYESRGVILKNRGAMGILSNQSSDASGLIPLKDSEVNNVQEKYKNTYGGLSHQNNIIITSANLKWQQMSVNPDKLGLFQEIESDFAKMMDAYGVPSELFASQKGATFENQNQARKGFYSETVIPEANEWAMGLNQRLLPDGKLKIIVDYSHLPIFQEDKNMTATILSVAVNALSKMLQDQAITIDEYKTEIKKYGIGR